MSRGAPIASAMMARTPRFDRRALLPGIVHLGLGAFARAHLAAVNDDAIEATGDLRFGIVGVCLQTPRMRDALAPPAGATRSRSATRRARRGARSAAC